MASRLPRYIFRRGGTLYIKLQPPGQPVFERSLGTSNVRAAELAASDLIKKHKQLMYGRRLARLPQVHTAWVSTYPLGLCTVDGKQVFATERELRDLAGKVIGVNGGPAEILTPAPPGGPSFEAYDEAKARPVVATKTSDDDLLETYIRHSGLKGQREREARDIWYVFKKVVNKPLAKCDRDDGCAVVDHLIGQAGGEDKIKRATLRRKLVPLVALCNLAIDRKKLTLNPFKGVVGKQGGASDARRRFTDDDMTIIRDNLHRLSKKDQLLVRVLATTGVRRGEAFEINREQVEDGIRFVVVGTKTAQSLRRVPFPKDLLPFLPKKIRGRLFAGRLDSASKRLRAWLDDIGIVDPQKAPMHSFRHRAKRRLENAKPALPRKLINAVGGWTADENKNSGDDYGKDEDNALFAIAEIKDAIDKIGF